MNISLKLIETDKQIQIAVMQAMLPAITKYFEISKTFITNNLPPLIQEAIIGQPEYNALVNGSLRLELGIPDADMRIAELLMFWSNNIKINYKPPKIIANQIKSSITINMIKADLSDVLSLDVSTIQDNISGTTIPWLEWLLLDGTSTLVKDYEVVFGPSQRSRTGFALMQPADQKNWSVPSEYAGTINDNWITRAISSYKDKINSLLIKALSQ